MTDHTNYFPHCRLHGTRVVTELPEGCLCGFADPVQRQTELQERGWQHLARDEYRAGNTLLKVADVCGQCVGRNCGRLRRYASVA